MNRYDTQTFNVKKISVKFLNMFYLGIVCSSTYLLNYILLSLDIFSTFSLRQLEPHIGACTTCCKMLP